MNGHRFARLRAGLLASTLLVLATPAAPRAHDIPVDVTVQAFLAPDGQQLRLIVRVPLKAMRDVDFPRRGPGYLDLVRTAPSLHHAATLWLGDAIALYENDRALGAPAVGALRVSLPSDRSFGSFAEALAHVRGSLPIETEIYWDQAMLDVLFEYPIRSDRSRFSIRPALARLGVRVLTVLRFVTPDGSVRAFEYAGDPGLVPLDPRWHQAAWRFVKAGFFHILDGTDHLLFLLCLVIPFRRARQLVLVVTAFTVAHSVTLIASAYGLAPDALWFPPLVETLIAMSIVYMALENILFSTARGAPPPRARAAPLEDSLCSRGPQALTRGTNLTRRWLVTFAFGLVHGFGFSFALRETLQFAGAHLLTSLLSFNIGVELGQLLVLAVTVPALTLLFRYVVAERMGTIILSALVAHTAWHWTTDRADRLRQYAWPTLDAAALASATRWLMAMVAVAGVAWLVRRASKGPAVSGDSPVSGASSESARSQ